MSEGKIISTVCEYYNISEEVLKSGTRKRPYAYARQICMYFLMVHENYGTTEAGSVFNLDHSTASHARKVVFRCLSANQEEASDFYIIESVLRNYKPTEALIPTSVDLVKQSIDYTNSLTYKKSA